MTDLNKLPQGRRRAVLSVLVLALAASASVWMTAPPACASNALVTCTGSEDVTFDPALTNTLQSTEVKVTGTLDCLQLLPPNRFSGGHSAEFARDYSCLTLLGGGSGTRVIYWDDGTTSTFEFQSSNQAVNGQFIATRTGQITSGRFAGHAALEVGVGLADLTACTTNGLNGLQTVVTFEVL
jgi:hypothetical protein